MFNFKNIYLKPESGITIKLIQEYRWDLVLFNNTSGKESGHYSEPNNISGKIQWNRLGLIVQVWIIDCFFILNKFWKKRVRERIKNRQTEVACKIGKKIAGLSYWPSSSGSSLFLIVTKK